MLIIGILSRKYKRYPSIVNQVFGWHKYSTILRPFNMSSWKTNSLNKHNRHLVSVGLMLVNIFKNRFNVSILKFCTAIPYNHDQFIIFFFYSCFPLLWIFYVSARSPNDVCIYCQFWLRKICLLTCFRSVAVCLMGVGVPTTATTTTKHTFIKHHKCF